jgi:hypothetical protein
MFAAARMNPPEFEKLDAPAISALQQRAASLREEAFAISQKNNEGNKYARTGIASPSAFEGGAVCGQATGGRKYGSMISRVLTAAPPMGNAYEPILFKCAHIEFVGGDAFDGSAVRAKPRDFIFLRGGAANNVAQDPIDDETSPPVSLSIHHAESYSF